MGGDWLHRQKGKNTPHPHDTFNLPNSCYRRISILPPTHPRNYSMLKPFTVVPETLEAPWMGFVINKSLLWSQGWVGISAVLLLSSLVWVLSFLEEWVEPPLHPFSCTWVFICRPLSEISLRGLSRATCDGQKEEVFGYGSGSRFWR